MKRNAPSAQVVPLDPDQTDFFPPGSDPIVVMFRSPTGVLTILIEEPRLRSCPPAAVGAALLIVEQCRSGALVAALLAAPGPKVEEMIRELEAAADAADRALVECLRGVRSTDVM